VPQLLDPAEQQFLRTELNKRGYQLHGSDVFDTDESTYLSSGEADELLESLLVLLT
jgi:hypothetical protein